MANIFIKGEKIAQTGLALLKKKLQAPAIFSIKKGLADFKGAEGDTISVKRPAILVARELTWRGDDKIVADKLVNTKIQISLNKHPYSAVDLSPEEITLDEINYVADVQVPQVDAVQVWFEDLIVKALRGAKFLTSLEQKFDQTSTKQSENDARAVAIRGRKLLNRQHVPLTGRYWLVGADVSEAIASHSKLLEVDAAGVPEALREGVVGKLGGFVIVELDALEPDESFFVHETAIAYAAVAPAVPQGATKGGGVAGTNGLAVTQVWDYNSETGKDRSIVHAFAGATPVLDPKIKADGTIQMTNGEPVMEFKRAVKVTFTAKDEDAETTPEGGGQ